MNIYHYDKNTKEFLYKTTAEADPVATKTKGEFVPLIPSYATIIEPPEKNEDEAIVFENSGWIKKPDYRKNYKKCDDNFNISDITTIGEIQDGYLVTNEVAELIKENPDKFKIEDNEVVQLSEDEYQAKMAPIIKNSLIEEFNYNLKAEYAYTGVRFDYNDTELIFETNNTSIGLINFQLTLLTSGQITEVANWKCRQTVEPYEPYSATFNAEQFTKLLTFASTMTAQAFAMESAVNTQIEALTVQQLNNEEYITSFKEQVMAQYATISVKLEGLFVTTEEEVTPDTETTETTTEE